MKKVFLRCYLIKNLGDDLFLKTVSERYENDFYIISSYRYKNTFPQNVKIINRNFPIKIKDRLYRIFKEESTTERKLIKKSDLVAVVSGSLFMEISNVEPLSNWYNGLNKDYYIIGSNIGPYKTEAFLNDVREIIDNAKDVCLRDKKSLKLAKNSNVRCAPDIIFSMDTSKYIENEKNKVIFSVINCDRKSKQIKNPKKNEYEEKMCEMIAFFQNKGYEIELMSFCEKEGDEETVKSIISKLDNSDSIKTFFYDGNIEEALFEIGSSKIVVGTRFHANILGLIMNKTVIPITYNNKTVEALKDIDYKGKIIDINEIEKFDVNSLTNEDLEYKCDVSKQKKDAIKHFEKLDKVLKLRGETKNEVN